MDKKLIIISIINFIAGVTLSFILFFITMPTQIDKVESQKPAKDMMDPHAGHQMMYMNDMLRPYSDVKFLELMIIHHQDALNMAENALRNSEDTFIRSLSENIIKTQAEEIKQMEEALKK